MSNSAVGQLYKRIIDQVVDTSRADFEENGVNNRMVQTFQEAWQDHLSKRRTANFPWEPQPTAASDVQEPPSTTSRAGPSHATRPDLAASPPSHPTTETNGVRVKQEPGLGSDAPAMSTAPATGFVNAQDRAQHLSQQYQQNRMGSSNYNPISLPGQQGQTNYTGMQYPNQQMYPQQQAQQRVPQQSWGQPPQQNPKLQYPHAQQYTDAKTTSPHIKQEQRPDGPGLSQTDGSADTTDEPNAQDQWSAIMARNREAKVDPETTAQADRMLKRHVADQMRSLEGGGLLVPLDDRYSANQRKKGVRGANPVVAKANSALMDGTDQGSSSPPTDRFDGGDDDDEDDKDAINSDLDDPEDDVDDGNVGEEYEGDTIICLYDKVQRVKNKWKCTLKDGVVNADGKDYVFHKANGEFEW